MIGVLGLEGSDLGLEIIELLSSGHSGVDGLDWLSGWWHNSSMMIHSGYTGDIKQPFSIGIGARAFDNSFADPSNQGLAMDS